MGDITVQTFCVGKNQYNFQTPGPKLALAKETKAPAPGPFTEV